MRARAGSAARNPKPRKNATGVAASIRRRPRRQENAVGRKTVCSTDGVGGNGQLRTGRRMNPDPFPTAGAPGRKAQCIQDRTVTPERRQVLGDGTGSRVPDAGQSQTLSR